MNKYLDIPVYNLHGGRWNGIPGIQPRAGLFILPWGQGSLVTDDPLGHWEEGKILFELLGHIPNDDWGDGIDIVRWGKRFTPTSELFSFLYWDPMPPRRVWYWWGPDNYWVEAHPVHRDLKSWLTDSLLKGVREEE